LKGGTFSHETEKESLRNAIKSLRPVRGGGGKEIFAGGGHCQFYGWPGVGFEAKAIKATWGKKESILTKKCLSAKLGLSTRTEVSKKKGECQRGKGARGVKFKREKRTKRRGTLVKSPAGETTVQSKQRKGRKRRALVEGGRPNSADGRSNHLALPAGLQGRSRCADGNRRWPGQL